MSYNMNMRREFIPFDPAVIEREMAALPRQDAAKLAALIEYYEGCGFGNPGPVQIDAYGDGLFRLRHIKPAYSRPHDLFRGRTQRGI